MTSRAEAILRELVSDPALAFEVVEGLPEIVGAWWHGGGRYLRPSTRGGTFADELTPTTAGKLARADAYLRRTRPGAIIVGDAPTSGPGIVPECGEVVTMYLAGPWWPPRGEPAAVRCDEPEGHWYTCAGVGPDGKRWSAGNAPERRARGFVTDSERDRLQSPPARPKE